MNAEAPGLDRVLARGAWSEVEHFAGAEFGATEGTAPPHWRIDSDGAVTLAGAPQGIVGWPAALPQLGHRHKLRRAHALSALPPEVVAGTRARYVEAFERVTGLSFESYLADPKVVL